jgi:hypothetical protein
VRASRSHWSELPSDVCASRSGRKRAYELHARVPEQKDRAYEPHARVHEQADGLASDVHASTTEADGLASDQHAFVSDVDAQSVVPPSPGDDGVRQMLKLGPPAPPSMAVSQMAPPVQAWLGSVVLQSATHVPVPVDVA